MFCFVGTRKGATACDQTHPYYFHVIEYPHLSPNDFVLSWLIVQFSSNDLISLNCNQFQITSPYHQTTSLAIKWLGLHQMASFAIKWLNHNHHHLHLPNKCLIDVTQVITPSSSSFPNDFFITLFFSTAWSSNLEWHSPRAPEPRGQHSALSLSKC